MTDHEIVLTPAKYTELQSELNRLLTVERPAIAERIRQARSMGDLSENFDYHDAKRQQGFLEGRIAQVRATLERARVTEYAAGGDVVGLGSQVRLHDQDCDEEIEYTIVGALEADPTHKRLSNTSPVGKALLGKTVGDIVEVPIPAGKAIYKIMEVR